MNTFFRGVIYWFKDYIQIGKTIDNLKSNPDKVTICFWINLTFASLYSLTPFLGYLTQRDIKIEPWIPIAKESYYLYQTFWTIPWDLATWIMIAGISHLLALIGKRRVLDSFLKTLCSL